MDERFKSQKILILAILAVVGTLLVAFLVNYLSLVEAWWVYRGVDFPEESEIQTMTASLSMPTKDADQKREDDYIADFPVPPEHLPKIFSTLMPAEKDYEPLPWFYMGSITLTCKDGREMKIFLYHISDDPTSFAGEGKRFYQGGKGAFSIMGPRGGVYFRGGNSKDLEAAIHQAHADYKRPN